MRSCLATARVADSYKTMVNKFICSGRSLSRAIRMSGQQRVLTLAFLVPTPDDHWLNRLTARVSEHPLCHVELYFESINQCFSIVSGEKAGFRCKNLSNPNYQLVSLLVSSKEYDKSLEFCRSISNQAMGFDERGMWASWFPSVLGCASCDSCSQHKGATFCSKIITEALQFASLKEVDHLVPSCTTPSVLYASLKRSSRSACNSVPFKRQALMQMSSACLG